MSSRAGRSRTITTREFANRFCSRRTGLYVLRGGVPIGGVSPRHVTPPVQCVGGVGGGDTLARVRSQAGCSYL
jgi:hypothetical protein